MSVTTHTAPATRAIVVAMVLGILVGSSAQLMDLPTAWYQVIFTNGLQVVGQIFIGLLKMLVVPIVLISIIAGVAHIGDLRQLGRTGGSALALYLLTSMLAIAMAMVVAGALGIGHGMALPAASLTLPEPPPLRQVVLDLFPSNPFAALAKGEMIQIIVLATLLGMSAATAGPLGQRVATGVEALNHVLMRLVSVVMWWTPVGVFCLLADQFSLLSPAAIVHVMSYFATVLGTLLLQFIGVYSVLLWCLAGLSPWWFVQRFKQVMCFAFSVSSSTASIPVVLQTVEEELGVDPEVAAFVIPLGATINMDGTAIMQGVATVFIANAYGVHLGVSGYLTVIAMATLSSVGTAGVPSVGLITLAMVLEQVGIPVQGIALIMGIDRLLDMVRTAVNVSGDAIIACIVARFQGLLHAPKAKTPLDA